MSDFFSIFCFDMQIELVGFDGHGMSGFDGQFVHFFRHRADAVF